MAYRLVKVYKNFYERMYVEADVFGFRVHLIFYKICPDLGQNSSNKNVIYSLIKRARVCYIEFGLLLQKISKNKALQCIIVKFIKHVYISVSERLNVYQNAKMAECPSLSATTYR